MTRARRRFVSSVAGMTALAVAGVPATVRAASTQESSGDAGTSVLDFMTPAMRADAKSGRPSLDHTSVIQQALDRSSGALVFPGGYVFRLTAGLTVRKSLRVSGAGELSFFAGIANAAALSVLADDCTFDGLLISNPNRLQSSDGPRNAAIVFRASRGAVTRCTIRSFQNGVQVESGGDYHDFVIADNHIVDCIGAGGGPRDAQSSRGEDRGDGITVWGSAATITGNMVVAADGQDCRIGIHVEALNGHLTRPHALRGRLCTISGNVVRGPFRRSIVTENVNGTSITGNTCEGATWWGIAVIRANACTVTGNSIAIRRAQDDHSGGSWSPIHAAIAVYGGAMQSVIANNSIDVSQGFVEAAISLQGLQKNELTSQYALTADGTTRVKLDAGSGADITVGALVSGAGVPAGTVVTALADGIVTTNQPIPAGRKPLTLTQNDRGQSLLVAQNSILCHPDRPTIGIWAQYQDMPTLSGNTIRDANEYGISAYATSDPVINGNTIVATHGKHAGIALDDHPGALVVSNNSVSGFDARGASGIAAINRHGGSVSGNVVTHCTTGVDVYGSTHVAVTGNSVIACATAYANLDGAGNAVASNAQQ